MLLNSDFQTFLLRLSSFKECPDVCVSLFSPSPLSFSDLEENFEAYGRHYVTPATRLVRTAY